MMTSKYGQFDADVFRAAQEEPTLLVNGRLHIGRLLSIEEWLCYADELRRLNADTTAPPHAYLRLYRRYLRSVFPRPWWDFGPDPVRALFRLPWAVVVECIDRFFGLQAQASTPSSPSRSTIGTDSPPATTATPPGTSSATPS